MNIVLFFHSLWNHPFLNDVSVIVAKYALVASVGAFVAAIISRPRAYGLLRWAVIGAAAAVALGLLGGQVVVHQRPFVVLHIAPLIAHAPDNSFPSDHSAVAAFFAALLWFVDVPSAAVATAAALALGIARVYCLVHWPIDVFGGWLVGALPAVVASLLWRARNGSRAHHDRLRIGRIQGQ